MSVSIANVRPAEPHEWDAVWRGCEYATYFHSREWSEIWQGYSDGALTPDARLVTFTDGVSAVLPLTKERLARRRGVLHWSSPAGTYGGWLTSDSLGPEHADLLRSYLIESVPRLWWRVNPYDPAVDSLVKAATSYEETQTLPLTHGFGSVCEAASRGHRCAVNKASGLGLVLREADSVGDWQTYFKIYENALARWGDSASSCYSWRLFEEMMRRRSPDIRLWLVADGDRVIAGGICLYAARHVAYWHAAALSECRSMRPANLLVHGIAEHACAAGYEWFDLNPSGGHEGVRVFKERCGAVSLPSPIFSTRGSRRRRLPSLGRRPPSVASRPPGL